LIPANYYYSNEDDSANQWSKKKQTKEEARAAKIAKFDPDREKTALDVTRKKEVEAQKGRDADEVEDESHTSEEAGSSNDEDNEICVAFDDEGNEIELEYLRNKVAKKMKQIGQQTPSSKARVNPEGINELRERLASRIQEMREKRKAPGTGNGAPSSREALLEARRQREDSIKARKAAKRKRDDDEDDQENDEDDEDLNTQSDDDAVEENDVIFSTLEFNDGTKTSADGKSLRAEKRMKKRDLQGQLKHIEARNAKLETLDENRKASVLEKSNWSRAILQASGEKVRDDEKLLRKSVKAQQKKKWKSEKEWKERKENVAKNIAARQAKREENIQAHKELKGLRGKKRTQAIKKQKQKQRAGFEGRNKPKKAKK
jgi:hypothetical protein